MAAPSSRSSIFQLLKQRLVGPKQLELEVSAYGKLPIYKDFLRHGLAAPEAQAFRRWLDRGVSKFWELHDAYRDQPIPTQALMVSFPATSHQVLAYLWDSHDHGGLRRFPFVLFVSLPQSKADAPLSLLFALDQLIEQGEAMRHQLASMETLDEYYPFIRTARVQLEIHSDKSLKERLGERKEPNLGDLGDIFYGEHDTRDRWPALIRHLGHLAAQTQSELAIRLPRTEALPPWELHALWCLLLKRARSNTRKPLQLIFPPRVGSGGVTLLHRELRPEDIFVFHPEMPEYQGVDDLRRRVPGAQPLAQPVAPPTEPSAPPVEPTVDGELADGPSATVSDATSDEPPADGATPEDPVLSSDDTISGEEDDGDFGEVDGDEEDGDVAEADGDGEDRDVGEADGDRKDGSGEDGDADEVEAGDEPPVEDSRHDAPETDPTAHSSTPETDAETGTETGAETGTTDPMPTDAPPEPASLPVFVSAMGKHQRALPPIALLNNDLLTD